MRALILAFLFAAISAAQEYRATLLGTVTDPAGAAVPMASVTVTNDETGVASRTKCNGEAPYILPAAGCVHARSRPSGFKTHRRGPIELRVNDRATIDVPLEIGCAADQVTVVADAPLIEDSTGSLGQVVGASRSPTCLSTVTTRSR